MNLRAKTIRLAKADPGLRNLLLPLVKNRSKSAIVGRHPMDGVRGHQLVTKAVLRKVPRLYSTENETDPTVWVKFFSPYSNWTWYVTEFDGNDRFFGYIQGSYPELGYFSLSELQQMNRNGLPLVERDMYFKPQPLSNFKK